MIRISTIFVAICMVLVAASLGLVLFSVAGIKASESAIVALAALTVMILYNAVSMRLRDRTDVGGQIADLSRGTADLARQVAEFGRRLAAIEGRIVSTNSAGADRAQSAMNEIGELGGLVKQLAASVASHDDTLAALQTAALQTAAMHTAVATHAKEPAQADAIPPAAPPAAVAPEPPPPAILRAATPQAKPPTAPAPATVAPSDAKILAAIRAAIETNQIELYLQPMVTLPQRKVRFYEAVMRIRGENDALIHADDFIAIAERANLMGTIDRMVLFRCVQVLRRLLVRNKDIGIFCNISAATLSSPTAFTQCLDFLDASRALAGSLTLEFRHATLRSPGATESEHLAALFQRGYRFSIDHVTDLRIEPRELADRGVKFVKVPASLLLDPRQVSAADVHAADLSDLLGRFGIDLIAERIEGERAVVDLLDYDVRFGQGFLFAAPKPLRPEAASATANAAAALAAPVQQGSDAAIPTARVETPSARMTGTGALIRRIVQPN